VTGNVAALAVGPSVGLHPVAMSATAAPKSHGEIVRFMPAFSRFQARGASSQHSDSGETSLASGKYGRLAQHPRQFVVLFAATARELPAREGERDHFREGTQAEGDHEHDGELEQRAAAERRGGYA
jgi:hypothetical protein